MTMAKEKTVKAEEAAVQEQETAQEPAYDPMKDLVQVYVPREAAGERNIFVGLNGKGWSIPTGEFVRVPRPVADILMQSNYNARYADEYKGQLLSRAKEQERTLG